MADKKITDLQQVSSITDSLNFPVDDTLQTYRATIGQVKTYLAPIYIPPVRREYTSGSGTHNLAYAFIVSAASATVGATYTNNGNTYTVIWTVSSANIVYLSGSAAPTSSGSLTKASGTGDSSIAFTAVKAAIYSRIKVQGAGGGGAGSANSSDNGGNGGAGGNTTFGTSLLTSNGGAGGVKGGATNGGAGGSFTISSPASGRGMQGGQGGGGAYSGLTGIYSYIQGGMGGISPMTGVNGPPSSAGNNGIAAPSNSGGGGSSGGPIGGGTVFLTGSGGGAGGFIDAIIINPSTSYSYSIGSAGSAGSAGSGGFAGGAGGSGYIEVYEYFQ